jgi:hypothetical protein
MVHPSNRRHRQQITQFPDLPTSEFKCSVCKLSTEYELDSGTIERCGLGIPGFPRQRVWVEF